MEASVVAPGFMGSTRNGAAVPRIVATGPQRLRIHRRLHRGALGRSRREAADRFRAWIRACVDDWRSRTAVGSLHCNGGSYQGRGRPTPGAR